VLGRTHGLSAGATYAAAAEFIWHPTLPYLAVNTAIAIGAGVLPDLDTVGSTVARSFGWISECMAYCVRGISGGHREGTHTGVGDVVCALIAVAAILMEGIRLHLHLGPFSRELSAGRIILAAYLALLFSAGAMALRFRRNHLREVLAIGAAVAMAWSGFDARGIAWAILVGTAVHAGGDALTKHGVPWLEPFSSHEFHLLPEPMRISTGHIVERAVIAPAMVLALAFLAWHAVLVPGISL
jgi:membrane-bound metal-dependent hydrolase YbcI (DUF457 family)